GHTQPGVALSNTSGNTIRSNWIGESATGTPFPNPFGVVFQANAVNNTATGNAFGPNTYANYFVADPSATGNVIDTTSPPTTPPPPSPPPPASGTGSPIVGNPVVVSGSPDAKAVVYTADAAGTLRQAGSPITAFPGFAGAVRTASADVNNDGFQDVILVTGPGTPARFTVMSGKDGTTMLVGATDPFGGDFTGAAFVA